MTRIRRFSPELVDGGYLTAVRLKGQMTLLRGLSAVLRGKFETDISCRTNPKQRH